MINKKQGGDKASKYKKEHGVTLAMSPQVSKEIAELPATRALNADLCRLGGNGPI